MIPMEVDLGGQWKTFWSTFKSVSGADTFLTILGIVGLLVFIGSVIALLWQKFRRKGQQGGGLGKIGFAVLLAGVFCAPDFLIPIVLTIADLIANALASAADKLFK